MVRCILVQTQSLMTRNVIFWNRHGTMDMACTSNSYRMKTLPLWDIFYTHMKYLTHHGIRNLWARTVVSRSLLGSEKSQGQKSKERSAVHLECSRDNHEQVKAFLRIHFFKTTKPLFLTGFPLIFIPDKMYISNKHANLVHKLLPNSKAA